MRPSLAAFGLISATNWVSPITLSSVSYPTGNGNYLADPFSPCTAPLAGTDQEQLLDTVCSQWFQTLSVMPQAIVAATFWDNLKRSPFHIPGSNKLAPSIHLLFQAFNATDPAPKRQRAITPRLLQHLYTFSYGMGDPSTLLHAHTADLVCGAFFFAMGSCEFRLTPLPGKTKMLTLSCILFRSAQRNIIDHRNASLSSLALYVTITFVDQKNGAKMDFCTQKRTGGITFGRRPVIADFDNSTCISCFRFRKDDLQHFSDLLWTRLDGHFNGLKESVAVENRYRVPFETGILILLYRLAPHTLHCDMEGFFGMRKSHLSAAFQTFVDVFCISSLLHF
jgi:hypothetical protein